MSSKIYKDEQKFGIVSKKIMRNKKIGIGAKGLYAYLSSHNKSIKDLNTEILCNELSISKERYNEYKDQLEKFGYIKKGE